MRHPGGRAQLIAFGGVVPRLEELAKGSDADDPQTASFAAACLANLRTLQSGYYEAKAAAEAEEARLKWKRRLRRRLPPRRRRLAESGGGS